RSTRSGRSSATTSGSPSSFRGSWRSAAIRTARRAGRGRVGAGCASASPPSRAGGWRGAPFPCGPSGGAPPTTPWCSSFPWTPGAAGSRSGSPTSRRPARSAGPSRRSSARIPPASCARASPGCGRASRSGRGPAPPRPRPGGTPTPGDAAPRSRARRPTGIRCGAARRGARSADDTMGDVSEQHPGRTARHPERRPAAGARRRPPATGQGHRPGDRLAAQAEDRRPGDRLGAQAEDRATAARSRSSVPRLVIAAPASDSGKTTVATRLIAALRARRLRVSPHKVGPDYIDPGYHALATGRPGRNLDPWLTGEESIVPLFLHGARNADVAVVEGVMGMYDGAGTDDFGSTAHIARLLGAPVVLVVDAERQARSVAALVRGFASFDERVRVAGVILNKVGSPGHGELCRTVLDEIGIPTLGVIQRVDGVVTPSRHLGLIPAAERRAEAVAAVDRMAELIARSCDLGALLAVARSAPPLTAAP